MKSCKDSVVFCLILLGLALFSWTACDPVLGDGKVKEKKNETLSEPSPLKETSRESIVVKEESLLLEEKNSKEESVVEDASIETLQYIEELAIPEKHSQPVCKETLFQFKGNASTKQVLLTGVFTGWAAKEADGAIALKEVTAGSWEAKLTLPEGKYLYKFIVDGNWIMDSANPNKEDDGVGGFNSFVVASPCLQHRLTVQSFVVQGNELKTTLLFESQVNQEKLGQLNRFTLDHQKLDKSQFSIQNNKIQIHLSNLSKGIHDLRVQAVDTLGIPTQELLLKVYVETSSDWRDVILYFAMLDRFLDGDASNNSPIAGVPPATNYQGGDFAGLQKKIEEGYFDKLGVNAIWITWPIENTHQAMPGKRSGSHWCGMNSKDPNIQWVNTSYSGFHGYWPAQLDKIEPHFGTLEELQQLVHKAHEKGIRIVLDFTVNHIHDDSALWKEQQKTGFFNLPKEICDAVGWDKAPITCWFTEYLPDLNYKNPLVVHKMVEHLEKWVKTIGADGLRLDALKHIDKPMIQKIRARMSEQLEASGVTFYLVGETFTGVAKEINSFVGKDLVHGQFDFPLQYQILGAFAKETTSLKDFDTSFRSILSEYSTDALMSTFLGNHDVARFISMASGDVSCGIWDIQSNIAQGWNNPPPTVALETPYKKLQLAFAFLYAIPGIPLVYYGDEIGLAGAGDPDNRRKMLFGSELNAFQKQTLEFVQLLGSARQKYSVLRRGTLEKTLLSENDVLVFSRRENKSIALVVLNRGKERSFSFSALDVGVSDGDTLLQVLSNSNNQVVVSNQKINVTVPEKSAQIWIFSP